MARIFLSHSSANNGAALVIHNWLIAEGWDDVFLDLDPTRGIAAGERWERRLYEAANRCEAVIFLVSRAWLASEWCLKELHLAQKLNKRIFGVLVEDIPIADLPADLIGTWQVVNLAAGGDHKLFRATLPDGSEIHLTFSLAGLARLKAGLTRAGLDPRFFAWPPADDPLRPPYRGLKALEAEDAGIFFGREAQTIEALDRLRGIADAAPPRFLVILGASGAGKSSFLRAGLLPRLERDEGAFLTLPIVRPERAALNGEGGLIRSLEQAAAAHGLKRSRAAIKAAVDAGSLALWELLDDLAAAATTGRETGEGGAARPPRIVLAVDQGEELFLTEGTGEANAFLALIRDLTASEQSNLIVLFTIRSDSFERLQTAPALDGVAMQTFNLPPMPRGAYQTVIEGPARRLAETSRPLAIEPALTEGLLADIEAGGGKDALPLLAFTLERLYLEYGGDGDLRLSEYRSLGGIQGSIEAAVDGALKAADADPAVPRDRAARLVLLRRALIPWLAGIDSETREPRRRVARLSEIPEEARPLVNHLIAARLLSTDVSPATGEQTIEPAHEALLRRWGLLQGWLEEDFAALATLEAIKRASRDWAANDRDAGWLAHTAGRLEDAEAIGQRPDLAGVLEPTDRDYLAACRTADTARRDRELAEAKELAEAQRLAAERQKQVAGRTRMGLIAASLLALLAAGTAIFGLQKASESRARSVEAIRNETISLASLSTAALAQGRPRDALELSIEAWPSEKANSERPYLWRTVDALAAILPHQKELARLEGQKASFSPDGSHVITVLEDNALAIWDAMTGGLVAKLQEDAAIAAASYSPDGSHVVTASFDGNAHVWDAITGAQTAILKGHEDSVMTAVFSPDSKRILTASHDKTARVWDAKTGDVISVLRGHSDELESAVFSPGGEVALTVSDDHTGRLWNPNTGELISTLSGHSDIVYSGAFSPDGTMVVTASRDGTARIWEVKSGLALHVLEGHQNTVESAAFSPSGNKIVTASLDNTARIWDVKSGAPITVLAGHDGWVWSARYSPDGRWIITSSYDGTARIWDVTTGQTVERLQGHSAELHNATFSPDGSRALTDSSDETSRLWEVSPGSILTSVGHADHVNSAAFSPDGTRVVTASEDKTARISDAATGQTLSMLSSSLGPMKWAAFSPDGARLVTVSDDKARIWDATTGAPVAVLTGHERAINSAAFSADGKRIVTASDDRTARIWDVNSGKQLALLMGHENVISSATFSPDGRRVATASFDGTIRTWDAATGDQILVLKHVATVVSSVAFSPDGKQLLSGSFSRNVGIWNAETGASLVFFEGPRDTWLRSAAFSPDGSRIATALDNTARLWDVATQAVIAELRGHRDTVSSVAFSPDGSRVVTASWDGTAIVWDISHLEKGDGFAIACRRLGNKTDLTDLSERYGLGELAPICGDHQPAPVDWSKLE